jgi:predicted GNAT superfamily acetyltransferase
MSDPQIQLVSSIADTEAMSAFFMQVWADGPEVVPFDLALAVQHVGGYSAVAKIDGNIVGASFGFQGTLDDGADREATGEQTSPFAGQRILHSHVTAATVPGVGFALKQHQKAWAGARGIDAITWTFDPLVRRNAVFNFEKLGAVGIEYLPNFYGTMTDAINAGDESDRLFTYWPISEAAAGIPASKQTVEAILVELPADIETLRKTNLAEALEWRARVRDVLEPALAEGYRVTGMLNRESLVLELPTDQNRP